MTEKDFVFNEKVKQKGIFNFKDLYEYFYDHLMDQDYDIFEKNYNEKILAGDAKQIELNWVLKKSPGSNYFLFHVDVNWLLLGVKKVKVKKEGHEVSMDSGSIELIFKAYLVKDPNDKWSKNNIFKFFRRVYDKFLIKERIEDFEEKLYLEVEEMVANVKSFLAIEGQHTSF